MNSLRAWLQVLLWAGIVSSAGAAHAVLKEGWQLQSSAKLHADGAAISSATFKADGWYRATVPCSVIGGLLQNHVYEDPFYGRNLDRIDPATFAPSWWYRKEFTVRGGDADGRVWLKLEGVNYRANVWLNGRQLADTHRMAGPFRAHEFDITDAVHRPGPNVLAIEVFRVVNIDQDLAIHFVDWNPPPPDMNLGILNDVVVSTSGTVTLRHPLVTTQLDLPSLDVAHLTVEAEAGNASDQPADAVVRGMIESIVFEQRVALAPHETRRVVFTPARFSQLNVAKPELWWPWEYGTPRLHTLRLEAIVTGKVSDQAATRFGIRQITSSIKTGTRIFSVNGRQILIRGAAWTPDLFQRRTPSRQEAEMRYARDLRLNTLRFEGKFEDEHLFDLADENGMLVLIGWCCCDAWQNSAHWNADQLEIADASLRTQIYRLRSHASMAGWFNGSDEMPAPDVERGYLKIEADLSWPNPIINSAALTVSPVSGASGVKMAGPYEWEPPVYWETDTERKFGGAWGFSTEISPGPAVPPLESLKQFIPPTELWPIGDAWYYHCGRGSFHDLNVFTDALNRRYGPSHSAAEYAKKAQVAAYEAHRAMFEAYGRHKYDAGGVIQWMLANAWPSMIWHLYDFYLRPGGSYFGVKNALEPVHLQYSYADQGVAIVNSTLEPRANLQATVEVYNAAGVERYTRTVRVAEVPSDGVAEVLRVPDIAELGDLHFVRLVLQDAKRQELSRSTYWVSAQADSIAWKQEHPVFQYTPQATFADYTGLDRLPAAQVEAHEDIVRERGEVRHVVTVTNTGTGMAFFVHLAIVRQKDGEEILPVLWQDNYITLVPGETRVIEARCAAQANGEATTLKVEAYNAK
jgi:exo-1,4-beta-D-glucosaminidase